MTVELLQTLSAVAYALTGLFFAVSVVLFFVFKIPLLHSDLTGRTEKKAIAAIRQQNEAMLEEAAGNTDQISLSGRLIPQGNKKGKKQVDKGIRYGNVVEKPGHSWQSATITTPLPGLTGDEDSNITTVLGGADETIVLSPNAEETVVLSNNTTKEETTLLSQNVPMPVVSPQSQTPVRQISGTSSCAVVEVDLFFAESKEIIQ